MHSSREPAALQRLSNQNADLNSALNWVHSHEPAVALRLCSELWWYWFRTNRAADGMKHLTRTLLANPGSGCVYAQAVAGLGYLAWVLDDYPLAFRSARDVLNMDGLAPSVLGLAHGVLARAAGDSGDCTSAIAEATAGAYCYQKAGNAWGVAWSRRCQASAQLLAGNLTASRESCVASRRTFERLGDSWGAAGAIDMLSSLSNRTGHYREALVLAQEAVLRHRDLNDTSGTRYSLQHLGEAALGMGDLDVALNAATESLTLSRNYGYRNGELRAQLLRAEVARRKCDTGEQEQASRAAIILATQLDDATLLERARELLTAA